MTRKVPNLLTDEAAEEFLSRDLSDLDFTQFKPLHVDFAIDAPVDERATMVRGKFDRLRSAIGPTPTPDPSPQWGGRGRKRDVGD